jgi:hypothetical protein
LGFSNSSNEDKSITKPVAFKILSYFWPSKSTCR